MKASVLTSRLASLALLAGSALAHEQCQCRTTVIVIEMPEEYTTHEPIQALTAGSESSSSLTTKVVQASATTVTSRPAPTRPVYHPPKHQKPPVNAPPPKNITHTFKPCAAPQIDRKDPKNFVPAKNVSLAYAPAVDESSSININKHTNSTSTSTSTQQQGSIDMSVAFKHPAVVLEHIESVAKVTCGDDMLTVFFSNTDGYDEAVKDWETGGDPFVLITGALDEGCAAEFERGFFVVENIIKDATMLSVQLTATKGELPDLAGEMEMTFTSLPAAELMRRLTVSPSWSLELAKAMPEHTTLFTDGKYLDLTAEEAWFSTQITFSGKLKYNFWGFKLQELYFDLDATFDSSAVISAQIRAAFQELVQYKPDDLAYSLIDVPGIVQLGPGLAFGLSVNVQADAAVDLYVGADIALPAGNVHIDFLDGLKTTTSGWEPEYNSFANATQSADVSLDVGADLTVMLKFKLLGGIVDLSSGFTASPGLANTFKLRGEQQASVGGNLKEISAGIVVPKDAIACAETNGLEFVSDFFFSLKAFATKWWEKELYSVRVPIVDYCLPF